MTLIITIDAQHPWVFVMFLGFCAYKFLLRRLMRTQHARRQLAFLEQTAALMGVLTPAYILVQIEELRRWFDDDDTPDEYE